MYLIILLYLMLRKCELGGGIGEYWFHIGHPRKNVKKDVYY